MIKINLNMCPMYTINIDMFYCNISVLDIFTDIFFISYKRTKTYVFLMETQRAKINLTFCDFSLSGEQIQYITNTLM